MSLNPSPNETQLSVPVWPPAPTGSNFAEPEFNNTSGTDGPLPIEIARLKFNVGAFGIPFFWLISHQMMPGAIGLLLANGVVRALTVYLNPEFSYMSYVTFGINIYLGFVGHKLAWKHRRFESLEQYFEVQKKWSSWSVVFVILYVTGIIIDVLYRITPHSH